MVASIEGQAEAARTRGREKAAEEVRIKTRKAYQPCC